MAFKNRGKGRPRITVRTIPCASCTTFFGQTQSEVNRNHRSCPDCTRAERALQKPKRKSHEVVRANLGLLEMVILKGAKLDRKKHEWYVGVRVRRRGSNEEFAPDKVYLRVDGYAPREQVEQAYTKTCARLQLEGARTKGSIKSSAEKEKLKEFSPWNKGKMFRDVGISRHSVIRFKVRLPDPMCDGETRLIGSFGTLAEARRVRNKTYVELANELKPCGCCGVVPTWRKGLLAHVTGKCQNDVWFDVGITRLLQAKLWNLVFAEGRTYPQIGKVSKEWLARKGYLFFNGKHYLRRSDVELNLSAASKHTAETEENEPVFE
jgi:hypothetical protein